MNLEYIAGFFDGEGCIDFTRTGQAKLVSVRVTIVNTNKDFLLLLQSKFGGKFYTKVSKNNPNWKPWCCITWRNKEAIEFLKLLKPFVILKLDQVKLAEEYWEFSQQPKELRCELVPILGKDGKTTKRYIRTDETLVAEQIFKDRMHSLNKKGVSLQ